MNHCWTEDTLSAIDSLLSTEVNKPIHHISAPYPNPPSQPTLSTLHQNFFLEHGDKKNSFSKKRDQLIRVFGGAYVLGQHAASKGQKEFKLVIGEIHTELTAMICRGKSVMYALVHLRHVQQPGRLSLISYPNHSATPYPWFNTLIFGAFETCAAAG